jgi:outer membrane biosynthesis protein TonB
MRKAFAISAGAHAAVLLWGLVSFSTRTLEAPLTESMPVDIISNKEFSELRAGALTAPTAEAPKPLVEKVAEKKPVDNPSAKAVEKPQTITASAETPSPPPPKAPESKAADPAPAKAETHPKPEKQAEKKEPQPDPSAEALKKDEAVRPEQKKAEVKPKPPQPKKQVAKPEQKFDAVRIAALLDRRAPQRLAATGDALNHTLAFGARTGEAAQLSQSEIDAFREKLKGCWSPPAGAPNADKISVPITIRLRPDRMLASAPQVEMSARDAYTQAMIDSAVRAIIECQPYTMFSPGRYEVWKEIPLDFDPIEMFRG